MTAEIRIAKAADASAIARVHVASWHETYRGMVPDAMLAALSVEQRSKAWLQILEGSGEGNTPGGPGACRADAEGTLVFVADLDGSTVGFASCGAQRTGSLRERGYEGEFSAIYVLQAAQRLGLGRRLMVSMATDLQGRGFRGAALWVLRDNARARRFYEFLGGIPVAERNDDREGGLTLPEVAYGWTDLSSLR